MREPTSVHLDICGKQCFSKDQMRHKSTKMDIHVP